MRTTTAAAQDYLAAVELQLADLPAEERSELLEDLGQHLADLEEEPDERPLEVRLGTAAAYAAELRVAAGLPAPVVVKAARRSPLPLLRRASDSTVVREVRTFAPQLTPAWWVLRGYLVVLLPCLRNVTGARDFPVPAPMHSHLLGAVLIAAAVIASILLGRRRLPRPAAVLAIALNVALAVAALNVLSTAPDRLRVRGQVQSFADHQLAQSPLINRRGQVTNVFPYAADGTPLEGVLLFDQDGRPLKVGAQHWWSDQCRRVLAQPRALDGVAVAHSYPQQYVLDPEGESVYGGPVVAGQCKPLVRPHVPVPVFSAEPVRP